MASVNSVTLLGNCGKDPKLRYSAGGKPVCTLSVATSERVKNKIGEVEEITSWHTVVLFDRLAEIAGEYVKKGKQVYIVGRISYRKWQDKDGKDRYSTEIVAREMQLLGGGGKSAGQGQEPPPMNDQPPF